MEINKKYYVIPIDRSKFTEEELEELEEYRQLAIRLKVIERLLEMIVCDAKTKRERDEWYKCIELVDQIKCIYDDELFHRFPQLPDKAVHLFY